VDGNRGFFEEERGFSRAQPEKNGAVPRKNRGSSTEGWLRGNKMEVLPTAKLLPFNWLYGVGR